MATVTKTFHFYHDMEGWTANSYTNSVLKWDYYSSVNGFLSASLTGSGGTQPTQPTNTDASTSSSNSSVATSNQAITVGTETPYFEYAGSWESLGVPSGSIISSIRLDSGGDCAYAYLNGMQVGPYSLYQNNSLQLTLKAGRTPSGSESCSSFGGQTTFGSQGDQSVPSAISSSATVVQLRFYCTLPSGGTSTVRTDELSYVITYSQSTSTGSFSFLTGHPKVTISATQTVSSYHGSMTVNTSHATLTNSSVQTPPKFNGMATLNVTKLLTISGQAGPKSSLVTQGWGYTQRIITRGYYSLTVNYQATLNCAKHPTFIAAGSGVVQTFTGTAVFARGATFVSGGTRVVPVFSGSLVASPSPVLAAFAATGMIPVYTGSAILKKSAMLVTSTKLTATYMASCNLSASKKTIVAAAIYVSPSIGNFVLSNKPVFTAAATHKALTSYGTASLVLTHAKLNITSTYYLKLSTQIVNLAVTIADDTIALPVTLYDVGRCQEGPNF